MDRDRIGDPEPGHDPENAAFGGAPPRDNDDAGLGPTGRLGFGDDPDEGRGEPVAPQVEEPTAKAGSGAEETAEEDHERPEGANADEARLVGERDEYLDTLRRLQAEFDNYRKRTARQQSELLGRATEGLLERLLPVLDAFDLALGHATTSPDPAAPATGDPGAFGRIASLLRDLLAKDGLERIDAVGVDFDPEIHDAVAHVPAEPPSAPGTAGGTSPDGDGLPEPGRNGSDGDGLPGAGPTSPAVVAEVLRAGYRLKGRVLRPAMVTVKG